MQAALQQGQNDIICTSGPDLIVDFDIIPCAQRNVEVMEDIRCHRQVYHGDPPLSSSIFYVGEQRGVGCGSLVMLLRHHQRMVVNSFQSLQPCKPQRRLDLTALVLIRSVV